MILLEYQAKAIVSDAGISIPEGHVVSSPREAEAAFTEIGGAVVVKAQAPVSNRAALGGVRFADTPSEARRHTEELFVSGIAERPIDRVLIERRMPVDRELYLGATYDPVDRSPTLIASTAGGTVVETAGSYETLPFSPRLGCPPYRARVLGRKLGLKGKEQLAFGEAASRLARAFLESDALLFELNPVTLIDGTVVALDAHLDIDDDALGRQPELARLRGADATHDRRTVLERAADAIDLTDHRGVAGRLVEFGGSLGLLIGGGGASLTVFDFVLAQGLDPANYCEIGGNPTKEKVSALACLLASQPTVSRLAVIMNVTNNTRADIIAEGVIDGILAAGRNPAETIAVFRIPGPGEKRCRAILAEHDIDYHGADVSLEQAVELVASATTPEAAP